MSRVDRACSVRLNLGSLEAESTPLSCLLSFLHSFCGVLRCSVLLRDAANIWAVSLEGRGLWSGSIKMDGVFESNF